MVDADQDRSNDQRHDGGSAHDSGFESVSSKLGKKLDDAIHDFREADLGFGD